MDLHLKLACFAAFGGLSIQLLELFERQKLPRNRRTFLRDPLYWLKFLGMPLLAAGVAYAYVESNQTLSPIMAVHVGASTPAILRVFAASVPIGPRNAEP